MPKRALSNHAIAAILIVLAAVGVTLVLLLPSRIHGPLPGDGPPPPRKATAPGAAKAAVVAAGNQFAFDLYGRLRGQEGNLFFSPHSLSTALAMTWAGARGPTADQIAAVLHLPTDRLEPAAIHAAYAAEVYDLWQAGNSGGSELAVVNRLWGQKGTGFLPEFLKALKADYGADAVEADFAGDLTGARQAINRWTSEATRGRITDMVAPDDLTGEIAVVLANAAYFKGEWVSPFDHYHSAPATFHVRPDRRIVCQMMNSEGSQSFKFSSGQGFRVLEMPYKDGTLAMLILLPDKVFGLDEMEQTISLEALDECVRQLSPAMVAVSVPKFKQTWRQSMAPFLTAMGMPLAFDIKAADFGGMSDSPLFLGAVIHQTYVCVDEKGTEAAAATRGDMPKSDEPAMRPEAFRANHPFLYLIRDTRSGAILFMGRVVDPTK